MSKTRAIPLHGRCRLFWLELDDLLHQYLTRLGVTRVSHIIDIRQPEDFQSKHDLTDAQIEHIQFRLHTHDVVWQSARFPLHRALAGTA